MNVDFAAVLLGAVVVSGAIWAVDAMLFASRRRADIARLRASAAPQAEIERLVRGPVLVEYARSFFPVFLAVLMLRSFLVEPFRIPSNSMMPTLLTGDFILVNKFTYGIRLPVADKKIIDINAPQRGDVVVFRYPLEPSVDYIKRVVGVPGDHIAYYNKTLRVNGQPVPQELVGVYTGVGAGSGMTGAKLLHESLGGVAHPILIRPGQASLEGQFTVPPGQYFVMGDNRDNSNDSRYWGTVPEQNLVGKAFMIWMNWDASNGGVSWGRIGSGIR